MRFHLERLAAVINVQHSAITCPSSPAAKWPNSGHSNGRFALPASRRQCFIQSPRRKSQTATLFAPPLTRQACSRLQSRASDRAARWPQPTASMPDLGATRSRRTDQSSLRRTTFRFRLLACARYAARGTTSMPRFDRDHVAHGVEAANLHPQTHPNAGLLGRTRGQLQASCRGSSRRIRASGRG